MEEQQILVAIFPPTGVNLFWGGSSPQEEIYFKL